MGIIKKQIIYRPGMISLVFIPLLCLWFFCKKDSFKVYGALDVDLVSDKENFDEYKIPTLRKYRVFNFNGSELTEKQKLKELKFFLRKLVIDKDTVIGIRTHFGLKTHFGVFVSVLDILNTEKAPTFAPYKDDIYILASSNKVKNSTEHRMNCGTMDATRRNTIMLEELEKEKSNLIFMNSFFKQQWILFIGYFGIVLLNIFALIKFNKR
jgi:hypothetical protein